MNKYRQMFGAVGMRRTELTFQRAEDEAALDTGEIPLDWKLYCCRFGGKVTEMGREYQAAMTTQAVLHSVYEIPYDDKTQCLTPRMRVKIGDRTLNIASVVDFEDRQEKIILGLIEPVQV